MGMTYSGKMVFILKQGPANDKETNGIAILQTSLKVDYIMAVLQYQELSATLQ